VDTSYLNTDMRMFDSTDSWKAYRKLKAFSYDLNCMFAMFKFMMQGCVLPTI